MHTVVYKDEQGAQQKILWLHYMWITRYSGNTLVLQSPTNLISIICNAPEGRSRFGPVTGKLE